MATLSTSPSVRDARLVASFLEPIDRRIGSFALALTLYASLGAGARAAEFDLVSKGMTGLPIPGDSESARMSNDGRYCVFVTGVPVAGPADNNGVKDVYFRDMWTGTVEMISRTVSFLGPNGPSTDPDISDDGRFVSFTSLATNLGPTDLNPGFRDVFVYDRATGIMELVSVDAAGNQPLADSVSGGISGDGKRVAFITSASLAAGDVNNGGNDCYVRDLALDATLLASCDPSGLTNNDAPVGIQKCSLSRTGRFVAFDHARALLPYDVDLVDDVYVKDLTTGGLVLASSDSNWQSNSGSGFDPAIDAEGTSVAFCGTSLLPGDPNPPILVYRKDLTNGALTLISRATSGAVANDDSGGPRISSDGRYVGFHSWATNLWSDDLAVALDVFLHDTMTGQTLRITSLRTNGVSANGISTLSDVSSDGRYVLFQSDSNGLLNAEGSGPILDAPNAMDIFRRDRRGFENLAGQTFSLPAAAYFSGSGSLSAGANAQLSLTGAPHGAPAILMLSAEPDPTFGFGGTLRAYPAFTTILFTTSIAAGDVQIPFVSPAAPPVLPVVFAQFIYLGGPNGPKLSNALYLGFD